MFLVLWEVEVKPSCERRIERVYGPPEATGIPCFPAIRTTPVLICFAIPLALASISPRTTGAPANPAKNSLLTGVVNTKH